MIDYQNNEDLISLLNILSHSAAAAGLTPRQAKALTSAFIHDWQKGGPDPDIKPMKTQMVERIEKMMTVDGDESDFLEDI